MLDAGKFSNNIIYWIFNISFLTLLISEVILFVVTFIRGYKEKRMKDKGSMLFLIICFLLCSYISVFFRSISFRSTPISKSIGGCLLPNGITYIGVIFMIIGMMIRWVAIISLNRSFTFNVQTSSEQKLVKTGIYQYIRNPAYSGSILSLLGVALSYRNILSIVVVLILCFICYSIRISIEEKALKMAFGKEFDEYCSQTKRIIPFIW